MDDSHGQTIPSERRPEKCQSRLTRPRRKWHYTAFQEGRAIPTDGDTAHATTLANAIYRETSVARKRLTVVDLFAGCGGLSLGLEQAGFFPLFVNELNEHAMQTYLINRQHVNPHLTEDGYHVHNVKDMLKDKGFVPGLKKRLRKDFGIQDGEIDLLVGGPPCQGFSGIGHRRSYSVDKEQLPSNYLFQDMAALIHQLKPRAFLFENVRGLMYAKWNSDGQKGEVWADVQGTFAKIPGYRTSAALLLAKDYGVPQNRPRVMIVGIRKDVAFAELSSAGDAVQRGFLPPPTGEKAPNLIDLLGDLIDPAYQNGGRTTTYPDKARTAVQKHLRAALDDSTVAKKGAPLTEHDYSKHSPKIVAKFKAMQANGGEIPEEYRTKKFAQRVLPELWGPNGPSITATSLTDDYVHFSQPRNLTVREWARLQMFPDWYQFAGKRTTGGLRRAGNPREGNFDREVPKYTQIGNAVPVKLAYEVGKWLASILEG